MGNSEARDIARDLHGSEYPFDPDGGTEHWASENGIVIIYGASDDLMEIRGFCDDERYGEGTALFDIDGLLPIRENINNDDMLRGYLNRKPHAMPVKGIWGKGGISWTYETDIEHYTFDIMEDGNVYCRGIVFSIYEVVPDTDTID